MRASRAPRAIVWAASFGAAAAISLCLAASCGDGSSVTAPQDDAALDAIPERGNAPAPESDADKPRGPSAGPIFYDDSLWTPVPDTNCYEGKVTPDPFPKRIWTSCGKGCRIAPAPLPFAEPFTVSYPPAAGEWIAGDVYLLLSMESVGTGTLHQLVRLSDEATVAAVVRRGKAPGCFIPAWGATAPLLFAMMGEGTGLILFGRSSPKVGAPIAWHDKNVPDPGGFEKFVFDDGYGLGASGGALMVLAPSMPEAAKLSGGADRIHGFGKQVVWGNYASPSIRSYTAATNDIDLVAMPSGRHPVCVRLSEDRLVWLSGKQGTRFPYDDVYWQWSPRATTPDGVVVHNGPGPIPVYGGLVDLQVGGDWAAVNGCSAANDASSCKVHVWHLTTGETWTLPHRPGQRFHRILAVTPTEIVLGETGYTYEDAFHIRSLVRIEFNALPGLVAAWGP